MTGSEPVRIWIDLDNAPHAPFFRPIIAELQARGHEVFVSARDDGQTVALARQLSLDFDIAGGWRGRSLLAKLPATALRSLRLAIVARKWAPDLAVSHGSRPMVLAAALLRIPVVTLYDYEGVAAGLFHRFSQTVIVPELVPNQALPGEAGARIIRYPGVKEQVYLADFQPAEDVRVRLGIRSDEVMVVLRPESETAHYRAGRKSPILDSVLDRLAAADSVCVALLPRSGAQGERIATELARRGVRTIVPEPMDGRDLVWAADLVVSGGGTMSREAAVLGVPAYSIFRGELGAVDRWLAETGRLVLVRTAADAEDIRVERRHTVGPVGSRAGADVMKFIAEEIVAAARTRVRRRDDKTGLISSRS